MRQLLGMYIISIAINYGWFIVLGSISGFEVTDCIKYASVLQIFISLIFAGAYLLTFT